MKKYLLFPLLIYSTIIQAQNATADTAQLLQSVTTITVATFESQLQTLEENQEKVDVLGYLCYENAWVNPEKGLSYGLQGLELSQRLDYKRGIAYCNQSISFCLWVVGKLNEALQHAYKSLQQYEELKDYRRTGYSYLALCNVFRENGDYAKGIQEGKNAIRIYDSINFPQKVAYTVIGSIFEKAGQLDSALFYTQRAYELDAIQNKGRWGWLPYVLGNIQVQLKNYDLALSYYQMAIPLSLNSNKPKDIVDIYNSIADVFKQTGNFDSSISYSNKVLHKLKSTSYKQGMLRAANNLYEIYKAKNQRDSTIRYLEMSVVLKDELFAQEKDRAFQISAFDEKIRRQKMEQATLEAAKVRIKNLQLLAIAAFILTFLVSVIVISRKKSLLKTARFLGLIGVLLIFEFINLLAHPLIENITGHNPFLILLILVLLASFLVPAHHTLEEMVKRRLMKKRKTKPTRSSIARTDTSKPGSMQ